MDIFSILLAYKKAKKYTDSVALNDVPVKTPQIDLTSKNWLLFDPISNAYIDTGTKAKGSTITIGLNKNWFIDSGDTGICAVPKDGEDGDDGFSPKIEVKTDTSTTYILTITTADSSYDTPNLKGQDGGSGMVNSVNIVVGETLITVDLTNSANPKIASTQTLKDAIKKVPQVIDYNVLMSLPDSETEGNTYITINDPADDSPTPSVMDVIAGLQGMLAVINSVIPNQAAPNNQLATQNFVNSTLQTMSANKVTYNANGDPFPTRNNLITASSFYFQGELYTPQPKDYCTVLADETHGGAQTRYAFDGSVWTFQFLVNDTPFTSAQNAAINSGITEQLVSQIDAPQIMQTSGVMLNTGDRVSLKKGDLTIWVQRSASAGAYSPGTAGFTFDTARD
jgi:hypothetical protein